MFVGCFGLFSHYSNPANFLACSNVRLLSSCLFDPWAGEKFDYIIDDISGVAERIAEISPWFKETACESGEDGTKLVIEAIEKSPTHLNVDGKFFFPILSLSNSERILSKSAIFC